METCVCNPNIGAEAGRQISEAHWPGSLAKSMSFRTSERSYFQRKGKGRGEKGKEREVSGREGKEKRKDEKLQGKTPNVCC